MSRAEHTLWTIDELGAQVALALSVGYDGPPNGRVRDVPDARTIRYYTTLGLLDRPAEMRGRTAHYGRRHLLQLVAIKRLQARGLALGEIQQRLLGQTDVALARLAQLPAPEEMTVGAAPASAEAEIEERESFWRQAPAAAPEPQAAVEGEEISEVAIQPEMPADGTWQGISLENDVLLLLATARSLDADEIAAIRVAAAPLLKLLAKRRLLRQRNEREPS